MRFSFLLSFQWSTYSREALRPSPPAAKCSLAGTLPPDSSRSSIRSPTRPAPSHSPSVCWNWPRCDCFSSDGSLLCSHSRWFLSAAVAGREYQSWQVLVLALHQRFHAWYFNWHKGRQRGQFWQTDLFFALICWFYYVYWSLFCYFDVYFLTYLYSLF